MLLQWHVKDPGQKCRWQVTPKLAYAHDSTKLEWADYATVQAKRGNLSGNELTRKPSGNTRSQSSQLAEPLWTDPVLKIGISVRELISTLKTRPKKKEKKEQAGSELSNILQKSSHARKKPPPPPTPLRTEHEASIYLLVIQSTSH